MTQSYFPSHRNLKILFLSGLSFSKDVLSFHHVKGPLALQGFLINSSDPQAMIYMQERCPILSSFPRL